MTNSVVDGWLSGPIDEAGWYRIDCHKLALSCPKTFTHIKAKRMIDLLQCT
jgi:hypothetical protein